MLPTTKVAISNSQPKITSASKRPMVLVVEDHDDTRDLLKILVRSFGYLVIEASDGEEAVGMAALMRPDLILMDTSLPTVDGLTATERIRAIKSISKVKIIFLSGHAFPQAREKALAAGGDHYIVKPINFEELEQAMKKFSPPPESLNLRMDFFVSKQETTMPN